MKEDLWNLVTYSNRDVTVKITGDKCSFSGNKDFLSESELNELITNARKARHMFRDDLLEGRSAMLEWSFAYASDKNKQRCGEKYLVFYEARTV